MKEIKEGQFQIKCADGYQLAASIFTPEKEIKGAIMLAPATGIKRNFYIPFVQHLATLGYGVITYDNRGIGESLYKALKKCKASLQEWGEQDMPAVLEELKLRFPNQKYHLIGHSAGGQLIGLMYNANELSSAFNVAFSSGRLANMNMPFKLQAFFFMDVFIPFSNALFGYANNQWVGMGEPLPKNVAKQWSLWCNGQGYVKTAFNKTVTKHQYDVFDKPMLCVNATDDDIAINKNVEDMLAVFTKAKGKMLTLDPKKEQVKEIGHMKFFSRKNDKLWKLATDWIANHN